MRLCTILLLGLPVVASAQVLFQEDFESASQFTLNTTDANSTVNISNTWLVNDVYVGGAGLADCSGFSIDFTIPATAGQPAGINAPNGNYLHTGSLVAIQNGILNCSFGAADGFCTQPDDAFARMTTDVSTVGQGDVSLKFWWLCNGGTQNYGEVYYSINAGATWTQITTPIAQYRNTTNWSEQTISLPVFAGQPTLRFGFRFRNGTAFFGAADPGFALDDVRILANQAATIATALTVGSFCQGSTLSVPYTANGSFVAGNVFTAQLSDATGGFSIPVAIGSIAATTSGNIACAIPAGTLPGTGYRIRVVSSAPAVIGSDNGTDLGVLDAPDAGSSGTIDLCSGDDPVALSTGGDAGGTWSGPSPVTGGLYDPGTMDPGTYTYTVSGIPPCPADNATIIVAEVPGANAGNSMVAPICKNTGLYALFDFLEGSPDMGGTWTGPGGAPFNGIFNSDTGTPGIYTYTVDPGGACPPDEAVVTVQLGEPGDAGDGGVLTVCSSDVPVLLTDLLVDANLNGVWYLNGAPVSASTSTPGLYTYIDFVQAPCINDTALYELVLVPAVDAGENATALICTNASATALLPLLGGNPDAGGTWTGPQGQPFSGLFQPGADAAGLYTYTVPAAPPCAAAEAVLAVVLDPCTGIVEADASAYQALQWLGWEGEEAVFATGRWSQATVELYDARGSKLMARAPGAFNGLLRIAVPPAGSGPYLLLVRAGASTQVVRFVR
jgi:hypothetical protein